MSTTTECQQGTFTTIALPSDAETLAYQASRMAEQHGPATELTPHGDHLDVHQPRPVVAPGTTGTATVRGIEGVRVMRLDWVLQHGEVGERATWVTATQVPDGGQLLGLHFDDQVSDFVPDPSPDDYHRVVGSLAAVEARLEVTQHERDEVFARLATAGRAATALRAAILGTDQ